MDVKIMTLGLLVALTAYGMNSIFDAETTNDGFTDKFKRRLRVCK